MTPKEKLDKLPNTYAIQANRGNLRKLASFLIVSPYVSLVQINQTSKPSITIHSTLGADDLLADINSAGLGRFKPSQIYTLF